MKLLVSACLLGCRCRYDGQSRYHPEIEALQDRHTLIPVCPEQLGGLSTPRPPSERRGDAVRTCDGADVTEAYRRGAEETLRLYVLLGCEGAVLKERSPACGSGEIYDGSFTGTLCDGYGVAAERLRDYGAPVYGERRAAELLSEN